MSPLVSVVSIVMSHVLRQDNMKTGRGVTLSHTTSTGQQRGGGAREIGRKLSLEIATGD